MGTFGALDLGLGLTIRNRRNGAFDPVAALFGSGEGGAAYAFPDMSSFYQDAAGTVPVTAIGQQVYRVADISGRSNHLLQATANFRPRLGRAPVGGVRNLAVHTDCTMPNWIMSGTSPPTYEITTRFGRPCVAVTFPAGLTNAGWNGSRATYNRTFNAWWPNTATGRYLVSTSRPLVSGEYFSLRFNGQTSMCNKDVTFGDQGNISSQWEERVETQTNNLAISGSLYMGVVGGTTISEPLTVYLTDIQYEIGGSYTSYQKVTDPWDVTEAGKRDCYCLYGDGIDDTMATTGNVLPVRNGLSVVGAFGHVSTGSSANQDALFGLSDLSTTYFTLRSRRQAAVRQAAAAVQNAAGAFGQTTALGDAGFDFGRPIVISATQNADALSVTTKNPDSSASGAATLDSTVSASVPIRVFPVANSSPVRWYGGIVIDRPLTDLERAFAMEHFGYLSGAIE